MHVLMQIPWTHKGRNYCLYAYTGETCDVGCNALTVCRFLTDMNLHSIVTCVICCRMPPPNGALPTVKEDVTPANSVPASEGVFHMQSPMAMSSYGCQAAAQPTVLTLQSNARKYNSCN